MYLTNLEGIEDLADQPEIMGGGGSAIIPSWGDVLAGPLYDGKGILHTDLDLAKVARDKFDLVVVGHYACPDVLWSFNEEPMSPVIEP